jgi:hypothetical protein
MFVKHGILLTFLSILVGLSIKVEPHFIIGMGIFLIYLLYTAWLLKHFLLKRVEIGMLPAWSSLLLGMFLSFSGLGYLAVVVLLVYKLTPLIIGILFLVNGIVVLVLKTYSADLTDPQEIEPKHSATNIHRLLTVGYVILIGTGFYLLYTSRTGASLATPWQTISSLYIYIFCLATFILGILIFYSKYSTSFLLFLVVIHSCLFHSYLPLTHQLFYGADQWRHIANEQLLLHEQPIFKATLIEARQSFIQKLDPGSLAYKQLWGITVMLARLLKVNLVVLNAWLVPIVWSVVFPILLYSIALLIGWGRKKALFFTWLGFLPFAWAVSGSLTLPNNLSFLWWLFLVIFLLKRLREPSRNQLPWLVAGGLGALLGYTLYFILFIIAWAGVEMVLFAKHKTKIQRSYILLSMLLFSLVVPFLEYVGGYSNLNLSRPLGTTFKELVKNFIGYYVVHTPGPQADVSIGNIIFNQPPPQALITNLFTNQRIWIEAFMIFFLGSCLYGIWICFRERVTNQQLWISVMTLVLTGSYFISRYILTGGAILSRRMDSVLALFLLSTAFIAWEAWYKKLFIPQKIKLKIISGLGIVGVFSIILSASYTLGPDEVTSVSIDQYQAVSSIWQSEQDMTKHCIVADIYPLMALEAVSAKHITGGGFPITQNHTDTTQPERDYILRELTLNPQENIWQEALKVTGAQHCWLIIGKNKLVQNEYVKNNQDHIQDFGNVIVWKYDKNNF